MRPDRGRIIIFEKGLAEVSVYTIDEIDDIGNNRLLRWNKAESGQGLFMLNTCVGHIKQLLGINRPFIWTPYQLYKYIGLQNGLFEKNKETAAFSAGTSSNHATDSRARQGSRGTMLGGVDAGPGYGGVSVAHPRILRQT